MLKREEGFIMLNFHWICFEPKNSVELLHGGAKNFCREVLLQIQMMNADCILHAALEGDRDQVSRNLLNI